MEDFDGSVLKAMDAELVTQHPQADQFLARDSAVFVFWPVLLSLWGFVIL